MRLPTTIGLCLLFSIALAIGQGQDAVQIRVHLATDRAVDTPVVYLHQIAQLSGASPRSLGKVGGLDLAETPEDNDVIEITKLEVAMRLKLAGLDDRQFRITGAPSVRCRRAPTTAPTPTPTPSRVAKIQTATFQEPIAPSEDKIVVKNRDTVQVFRRLGKLTLSVAGEAMEDGRMGQLVRVRNINTKQVIIGRVRDGGVVEAVR